MSKDNVRGLFIAGVVWTVIQSLISCGIFITFKDMAAYAAPKDSITVIENQLNRIEEKVDKLIIMRH